MDSPYVRDSKLSGISIPRQTLEKVQVHLRYPTAFALALEMCKGCFQASVIPDSGTGLSP